MFCGTPARVAGSAVVAVSPHGQGFMGNEVKRHRRAHPIASPGARVCSNIPRAKSMRDFDPREGNTWPIDTPVQAAHKSLERRGGASVAFVVAVDEYS